MGKRMKSVDEGKSIAERIARDLIVSWSSGRFEPLGNQANAVMKSLLTPKRQKETYQAIKGLFGSYESLTFIEAWGPVKGLPSVVYRFKARFSNSGERPEIRVVIDRDGKLSGFWIKPWHIKV